MTINLSLSFPTKLREAEVVSWTDENSFELDIVGRIPSLSGVTIRRKYTFLVKNIHWSLHLSLYSIYLLLSDWFITNLKSHVCIALIG